MRWGAPLLVSAVCLAVVLGRLDWSAVVAALAGARWPLVALAALLVLTQLGLRAIRWRLLLGPDAPPLAALLWSYLVGVAAGLVLPGSGELARAVLLARRGGLRTSFVLGSVAVEKLLDTGVVLGLFALGLWHIARLGWLGGAAAGAAAFLLLALGGIGAALLFAPRGAPPSPPGWLPPRLARCWERLGVALAETWLRFAGGVATVLRLPRAYQLAVSAVTVLAWANACLATVLALVAFDLPADWAVAAVLYGALLLGLSVPSAPAAVGPFELVTVAVLEGVGYPSAPSAAFALGFHALTFVPPLVVGVLAYALAPSARGRAPAP